MSGPVGQWLESVQNPERARDSTEPEAGADTEQSPKGGGRGSAAGRCQQER